MKKILIVILLLSLILPVSGCGLRMNEKDPMIAIGFVISDLTDEEFQYTGTHGIENASKQDFKKMEYKLDIKHSDKISDREIFIPNLKDAINSYGMERYWYGSSSIEDNSGENSSGNCFRYSGYRYLFDRRFRQY